MPEEVRQLLQLLLRGSLWNLDLLQERKEINIHIDASANHYGVQKVPALLRLIRLGFDSKVQGRDLNDFTEYHP